MSKWRMVIKSSMSVEHNMVQVACEPYMVDKIRTSLLETVPDEDENYLTEIGIDSNGKRAAIKAHGYEIIEEEEITDDV